MANLDPLIRVRKHALEQKQKFLAELYRQAEQLHNQKTTLLDTLANEQEQLAGLGVQMLPYFGPYSKAVRDRVDDIDDSLKRLDTRISAAREDMREAFAEFKKIELTQQARKSAEIKEFERKISQDLDATGIEIFRRREDT
jgi:hypothetical protein